MTTPGRRAFYLLTVTAITAATVTTAVPAAQANVAISFPTQAMEGNLQVSPGATVEAGYSFSMPGQHPAARVAFPKAKVIFEASCVSGTGGRNRHRAPEPGRLR